MNVSTKFDVSRKMVAAVRDLLAEARRRHGAIEPMSGWPIEYANLRDVLAEFDATPPAPSPDRIDLAARFAVALAPLVYATGENVTAPTPSNPKALANHAFALADAFLAASKPASTAAPVEPPAPVEPAAAAPYVPQVGDIVAWEGESDKEAESLYVRVVTGPNKWSASSNNGDQRYDFVDEPMYDAGRFVRRATAAERKAVGLPEVAS